MRLTRVSTSTAGIVAGTVVALVAAGATATAFARSTDRGQPRTVIDGLNGPRGVATLGHGRTLVTESDGTFSLVREHRHGDATKTTLGSVAPGFGSAIDNGRHGSVYVLTGAGGGPGEPQTEGSATLFKWKKGWAEPRAVANIADYQATDPDPYDLEGVPADSNPFGVAALKDGTVLVSDAAGNDLLRVWPDGTIKTVARLKPRVVAVPEGLPATDPESGQPFPPAGTMIPSEDVATSVTVGADGYWYVGELRGFPAAPGTSQVWRIKPGSVGALCDPEHPRRGACQRYADGLSSIVDLGADRKGNIYAVSLSKLTWLQLELGTPGAEVGAVYKISRTHGHRGHGHHKRHGIHTKVREISPGSFISPGGVDVDRRGTLYETGPVFGPGALLKLRVH